MVDVYAVRIDKNIRDNIYNKLISCVSHDKKERIKRYHRLEDGERTLIGDVLVRFLICKKHNIKNEQLCFGKNEYGKPFLINSLDFQFNISHSGEWIVCATHYLPLGIDIELIQPIDLDIVKHYFSEVEYRDLMKFPASNRLEYFYELWTLKESYVKAAGQGLSLPLNSFSLSINNRNITITTKNDFSRCYFKQYEIHKDYKMSVCASKNDFCDKVITLTLNELYEEVCQYELF